MAGIMRRQVGETALHVSELGYGTVALGLLPDEYEQNGERAVLRALEKGVTLFDTAPFYGNGKAERRLGRVLRELPRGSFEVTTKVGRLVGDGDAGRAATWSPPFDYSYDGVMRSFESSLSRLGVDRVDGLLLHDIGSMIHGEDHARQLKLAMESGYRALAELKAGGGTTAIGIGVNEWQVLEEAMAVANFDLFLLAGRYTLLEQTALETFLPQLKGANATTFAGAPFNSGVLAQGPRQGASYNYAPAPDHVLARVRAIAAICERYSVPLAAAAIQFPAAHPAVSSVVFGPKSVGELDEILDQFTAEIPSALWSELKSAGLLREDAPVP
jgi:D-threo-aldose 1-dehydrogenase